MDDGERYRVAVASSDGIVVNEHFGRARTFYIWEVSRGKDAELVEKRTAIPICHGGTHEDSELMESIKKLTDCKYVLVSRIGTGTATWLEQQGIIPMELPAMIEESLEQVIKYEEILNLLR